MTRRLRIVHRTGYRYTHPVIASFNEARMTPADGGGQWLISHRLTVSPAAAVMHYTDYWGTTVEAFDVHSPHQQLEVSATSLVDSAPATPRATALTPQATVDALAAAPSIGWDALREAGLRDRLGEFLRPSAVVDDATRDVERAEVTQRLLSCPTPAAAVRSAMAAVRERLMYEAGSTHVATTAAEAWRDQRGVCQDFTHVMLSLVRSAGIPARYVSGYLHSAEPAPGETVVGESHAWVEVWLGEWVPVDPTNARAVGAAHITVARGRDYRDVAPLTGIYAGGASEELGVSVQITQLAR
jgi:transglutaminase-like putative cysteine protease